jgi:ankyrin repeat protein
MTALYLACQEGYHDMAALLISHGADVNKYTRDDIPCVPLHMACQYGHTRVAKLLLRNGANVDAVQTRENITSLCLAIRYLHADIALLLIESGASIHIQNTQGVTALMVAANRGLVDVIKVLVDKGANP